MTRGFGSFDLVHFLVYYWIMSDIRVNMHQAKTHLSRYLSEMTEGDRVIICNRNRPVAELRLLPRDEHPARRRLGVAKGEFEIPASFFEPLAEDVLEAFEGRG
jgi:antitoxin (DNA-binding transcriptional repressor) of toxin-antitoxin stability system